MLTLAVPSPLNGRLLADQFAAAGLPTSVAVEDGSLVMPGLSEPNRPAAQSVVDAHPATAQAAIDAASNQRTNETTLRDRAAQALKDNATFLGITSPTNAQVATQVKALTRQNQGLIRLLLQRFDGTD